MGALDGFIKVDRKLPNTLDPKDRIKNFKEFYIPHAVDLTRDQASRCMDCGVPFCHKGCPLGNLIPDFNDAVYREDWKQAIDILSETNNFPEFTGRICPAPCEGSCVLGINKPPVSIEHIEKTIVEQAFELGYIKPRIPETRRKERIAVVGSGPAGMAAADQLNQAGYQVEVFERDPKPGGLLRFGIPDFKLEKNIVERRIQLLEEEGIKFTCDCNVGVDISADDLRRGYDAVVLTGGATIPRDLPIEGRDLKGVHFAMEFLTQQNRRVSGLPIPDAEISASGKNVIVIGGGDTGSDCIGTSNRHGAESIVQFELLVKPPGERAQTNPWPEWPQILRTSSSHEEGAEREWSILTKAFIGNEKGEVTGLKTVDIEWQGSTFAEIPGSERVHPCDLALLAIGFTGAQKVGLLEQLGVELDERGNIKTQGYQTSVRGVFAAGDGRRGQSLVVWAISEGREAAREVDAYLSGTTKLTSKELSGYQM